MAYFPTPGSSQLLTQYAGGWQNRMDAAAAEKKAEYGKGYGIYSQLGEYFKPGGGYLQGTKYRTLAAAKQGTVGTGLYGSTRPVALSADIERQIEEARAGQYANVMGAQAEYAGKYAPIFPSSADIARVLTGLYQGQIDWGMAGLDWNAAINAQMAGSYDLQAAIEAAKKKAAAGGGGAGGGAGGGGGYTPSGSAYYGPRYEQTGGGTTGGPTVGGDISPESGKYIIKKGTGGGAASIQTIPKGCWIRNGNEIWCGVGAGLPGSVWSGYLESGTTTYDTYQEAAQVMSDKWLSPGQYGEALPGY